MSISLSDQKILWSRAGGICSNPDCNEDLTLLLESGEAFHVGEMAHIIARNVRGPRSDGKGGNDSYSNLVLLCPKHHRIVDKAPEGTYPAETLLEWKRIQEARRDSIKVSEDFEEIGALTRFVCDLLAENKSLLDSLGPASQIAIENPLSGSHNHWVARKLSTILPNNRKIVLVVERNRHLLSPSQFSAFLDFKVHVAGFEANQYDVVEDYPRFPSVFSMEFAA